MLKNEQIYHMVNILHQNVKYKQMFIKLLKIYWHERSYVIKWNYERVIRMKFLKKNKGVLIFYVVILLCTVVIANDVKRDEMRENNRYVMTNLPK